MSARQNIELKVRCADLAAVRAALVSLAPAPAVESQTDTYFRVPHGRLKLREIDGQPAVLVAYDRPDRGEFRLSTYHLVPAPDPAALKAALAAVLGSRGSVRKRREIYLWHNVRIHLDEVADLGTFVEFEAVLGPGADEATSRERLHHLGRWLGVADAEPVPVSYADLLGL